MQVGLNARILRAPRAGIGTYVRELSRALQASGEVALHFFDGWRWSEALPAAPQPGYRRWTSLGKLLPNAYALRRRTESYRFNRGLPAGMQLYHEPSLWPLPYAGPTLITVHDLTHERYPETQPADRLREIQRQLPSALTRARHILTVSEFTATEIVQHYGIDRSRIRVTPEAPASHFRPHTDAELLAPLARFGVLPRQYFLAVGTLEPRKNLPVALQAQARLPAAISARAPLLIVGMPGWQQQTFSAELDRAIRSGLVRFLGYQSDTDLAQLMAGATALVFPSRYEGFGLPVLEAMASGTPVILGRNSALPEVADNAGLYTDTTDASACAEAMQQLWEDSSLWHRLQQQGLAQAQHFSWTQCAAATLDAYQAALS